MSKNDMEVLMCKVLVYLYACIKDGRKPVTELLQYDGILFGVNRSYWLAIWEELILREAVRGVSIRWADDVGDVFFIRPEITYDGVLFLRENSGMRRALKYIKKAQMGIPGVASVELEF